MLYEQTRIDIEPKRKRGTKMDYTIWQPDTKCKPWAVHVRGYKESTIDVILYHEDINEHGRAYFAKVKAPTPKAFLDFVSKQIQLFASFQRCDMEYRTCDAVALYDAYRDGVRSEHVLNSKSLFERI